jgi:hypothetical protein
MLKKLLFAAIVLAVVLGVVIAVQPADFRITRSAQVAAPADVVFAQVNDLHKWEEWSPWAKLDPAMKQTYEGAPVGVGASYTWEGNNEVGAGRSTIVESRPGERVGLKLDFTRPFAATNNVEFTFQPEGAGTVVTWTMTGTKNFLCKGIHMVIDVDKMCGGQFEQGLAKLKKIAENEAKGPQGT